MKKAYQIVYLIAAFLILSGATLQVLHYYGSDFAILTGFVMGIVANRLEVKMLKNRITELEEKR